VTTAAELRDRVRECWAHIPAPPLEDVEHFNWEYGEDGARAFVGVAPMDVDRESAGFDAVTPLLDGPPRAAAAYLGTFVMSLLEGIEFQEKVGIFDDLLSRAHTLAALSYPDFWDEVILTEVPPRCRKVIADVVTFLASPPTSGLLALTDEDAAAMLSLAARELHAG
jgi:hypothetical protein